MHLRVYACALPIVAVAILLLPTAAAAQSYSGPLNAASPTTQYGYAVSNYDADLLLARQNLDRFWGDPYTAPGNENKWYTSPGFSWLNELGGTHTACGDLEPVDANRKAFFYCYRDKVVYVDYSQLRSLHATWGYDGVLAMLAHEYGHHLQNLLGVGFADERKQEWQADCFSGTALHWFQRHMPALNQIELASLAYATGGGSAENIASHGLGATRQYWWNYGWDNFNLKDNYQLACLSAPL